MLVNVICGFSHLAFVQLAPCEMGKCHLDGFALDPVNKAIAHWAAQKFGYHMTFALVVNNQSINLLNFLTQLSTFRCNSIS